VAAALSITNTTEEPTQISHHMADVRRVDGAGPSFVPAVKIVPETLELGPEEEGTLTVSLGLDPEKYDTDALYTGTLYLAGGADVPLEVELRILATAAASVHSNG
jgi:hypothetical protein